MSWGMGGMGMGMGMGRGGFGGRGTLAMSDEDLGKAFDWRLMKRLIAYAGPYKKRAFIGLFAMIVFQITNVLQPLLPGFAIDHAVDGDTSGLFLIVGLLLLSSFVNWMANYQQSFQMARVGQWALYDIASAMFRHITKLSLSFFDKNETGRIMSRVQNDVTVLQNFLSQGLISSIGSLLSVVGILVALFVINWELALYTSVSIPLFAVALLVWQGFSRRAFRKARATISVVNSSLQENVSGVRVIQSMGREGRNSQLFDNANTANLEANLDAGRVSAAAQPIVEITHAVSILLVMVFGGRMVIDGSLSVGGLLAFLLSIERFFEPIRMLTMQYNQMQRATVAAERIFEILDTESDVSDKPDAYELPQVEGHVTYDHVQFAYVPGVDIFKDLDLDIRPGEKVAFVGHTGAGKSTIVSLLLRFYDVTGGRLLVDGHDIRDVTMQSLRRSIGIVLQEPVLFSGSIADNIRYARPDATDEEVQDAARAVGLHETIMRMENGYDSLVNERGIGLSIGQRQLLSFARVLVNDPRILILDEATASLDTATELVVQQAIKKISEGRTALMIAHRLSTIRDADRIVVLENGRVIESGTHDELIALHGTYHHLYSMGFRQAPSQASDLAPAAPNGREGRTAPVGRPEGS